MKIEVEETVRFSGIQFSFVVIFVDRVKNFFYLSKWVIVVFFIYLMLVKDCQYLNQMISYLVILFDIYLYNFIFLNDNKFC